MLQRISNNSNVSLTFTDDSITWESSISRLRFPYGSIKQVRIGFLGFEITPCEGNSLTFAFNKKNKSIMQEMLTFTQNAMKTATPAKPINLTDEKEAEQQAIAKSMEYIAREIRAANEHRMHCNVCGHIFCYTDDDLKQNQSNAKLSAINAVGGLASTLGGTIYSTHHLQGQADRYADRIIDYSRCPSCRSNNISEIKESETLHSTNNGQKNEPSSVADELKKFKELLDSGIITQEEFDAKKKQLLGL